MAAVFAVRVRPDERATPLPRARRPALGLPARRPGRGRLAGLPRCRSTASRDNLLDPEAGRWFRLDLEPRRAAGRPTEPARPCRRPARCRGRLGGWLAGATDDPGRRTRPLPSERGRQPPHLPLEGRHDPPDLRLRGRLASPRARHGRAGRRRARPDLLRASSSRSRSSPSAMDAVVDAAFAGGWRASAASRSSTSRASRPATTTPTRSSPGSPTAPDGEVQDVLADAYAAADPRGPHRRAASPRSTPPARRPPSPRRRPRPAGSGRSAPSTARTCSSSRARSRRPATSPPATTRSRSTSSPGSCRSRSRSATRRTPRPPSR